jgi:hypothetical protein
MPSVACAVSLPEWKKGTGAEGDISRFVEGISAKGARDEGAAPILGTQGSLRDQTSDRLL